MTKFLPRLTVTQIGAVWSEIWGPSSLVSHKLWWPQNVRILMQFQKILAMY